MAEVSVLGLGYVGLPTASLLANAGFYVQGVDTDQHVVELLRSGRTRLEEAGLATLVSAAFNSRNLVTATKPEASDTFMICVPTPILPDKAADLRAVESATRFDLAGAAAGQPGHSRIDFAGRNDTQCRRPHPARIGPGARQRLRPLLLPRTRVARQHGERADE